NTRRMRRASWRRAAASEFLRVCALHARAKCFKLPHRALTLRAIFPIRDRLAGVWKCALQAVAGLGPRRPRALLDADGAQRAGSPPASERIVTASPMCAALGRRAERASCSARVQPSHG